ncbi:MAG TPA: hypothetical protein VH575_26530 [Gemmataceae bacterium]|jgi:hypothetical protein
MGLLRWLAVRFVNMPLHHVTSLSVDEQGIRCVRMSGARRSVAWGQIQRVLMQTTDKGPFDDDVFFVLETATGMLVVPQQAKGSYELLCYLQQLPDFDNKVVIEAMACTENREFLCWQRAPTAEPGPTEDRPRD